MQQVVDVYVMIQKNKNRRKNELQESFIFEHRIHTAAMWLSVVARVFGFVRFGEAHHQQNNEHATPPANSVVAASVPGQQGQLLPCRCSIDPSASQKFPVSKPIPIIRKSARRSGSQISRSGIPTRMPLTPGPSAGPFCLHVCCHCRENFVAPRGINPEDIEDCSGEYCSGDCVKSVTFARHSKDRYHL